MHNLSGRQGRSGENMARQGRGNCLAAVWAALPGWTVGDAVNQRLLWPLSSKATLWRVLQANVKQLQLQDRALLEWIARANEGSTVEKGREQKGKGKEWALKRWPPSWVKIRA